MLKEPPLYLIRVKYLDREQRLIESFQILRRNRCIELVHIESISSTCKVGECRVHIEEITKGDWKESALQYMFSEISLPTVDMFLSHVYKLQHYFPSSFFICQWKYLYTCSSWIKPFSFFKIFYNRSGIYF